MLSLYIAKAGRNRNIARSLAMAVVIAAMTFLPLGLPGAADRVTAQSCWPGIYCGNGAFNVGALVSTIDVTWNGGHHYRVKFNLQSGVGTTGTCGAGSAVLNQITDAYSSPCGSGSTASDDAYALDVNVGTCSGGSFTVGYKVYAYHPTSGAGRVHGNATVNSSDFTYSGQTITNYAPVPGC